MNLLALDLTDSWQRLDVLEIDYIVDVIIEFFLVKA